jgi:hypothetical protein
MVNVTFFIVTLSAKGSFGLIRVSIKTLSTSLSLSMDELSVSDKGMSYFWYPFSQLECFSFNLTQISTQVYIKIEDTELVPQHSAQWHQVLNDQRSVS